MRPRPLWRMIEESPNRYGVVIGHRYGDGRILGTKLHDYVTTASAYLNKTMLLQNSADLPSGKDAQSTHAQPRTG